MDDEIRENGREKMTFEKQESRAVARKLRDAAAVPFALKPTFTTSLRVATFRKSGFRAPNIPAQNRI